MPKGRPFVCPACGGRTLRRTMRGPRKIALCATCSPARPHLRGRDRCPRCGSADLRVVPATASHREERRCRECVRRWEAARRQADPEAARERTRASHRRRQARRERLREAWAPVLVALDPLDVLDAWAAERPAVRGAWLTRRERREA